MNVIGALSPAKVSELQAMDGKAHDEESQDTIIRLQMDVVVFALSVDYTRIATLKLSDRVDDRHYRFVGNSESFHDVSHRDGPMPEESHRLTDRHYAEHFKYFLDALAAVNTPTGPLIDQGAAIWVNQQANGDHDYGPLPYIIGGSAKGFFKQGQYIDIGERTPNCRLLNTFLAASGVRKADGSPTEDFGEASLPKKVQTEVMA